MRLTHLCNYADKRKNKEPMIKIRNKLFELENIEDELGIDLITLFRLFETAQLWVSTNSGKAKINLVGVSIPTKTIHLWDECCGIDYPFSEYRKSFAFTKEELL